MKCLHGVSARIVEAGYVGETGGSGQAGCEEEQGDQSRPPPPQTLTPEHQPATFQYHWLSFLKSLIRRTFGEIKHEERKDEAGIVKLRSAGNDFPTHYCIICTRKYDSISLLRNVTGSSLFSHGGGSVIAL